jgi:hypothetical protein
MNDDANRLDTQAATAPPLDARARLDAALARIEASRSAMRQVLVPQPELPPAQAPEGELPEGWRRRFADGWQNLRDQMGDHPAVSVAMNAAQGWWRRQPLRPVVGEIHGVVTPWVKRHPVLAVSLAAALAAGIVFARPWRVPAVRARLHGAPQRAGRWLWHQLTQAPVQSLLASLFLGAMAARKAQDAAATSRSEAHATTPPPPASAAAMSPEPRPEPRVSEVPAEPARAAMS